MFKPQPLLTLAGRGGVCACPRRPPIFPQASSRPVLECTVLRAFIPRPRPRPLSSLAPAPTVSAGRTMSFADQLARKNVPTVLYEAPSHTLFRLSSYSAGIFLFLFSGFHYVTGMANPPADIAWYVPHLYGIVVLAMGSMGTFFISGAGRIVRVISAVPRAAEPIGRSGSHVASASSSSSAPLSPAQKAAEAATAAASRKLPIQLEVTASRYIPFMGPQVIRVEPDKLVLPARLQQLREMVEILKQGGTPGRGPANSSSSSTRARLAEAAARKAQAEAEAKYDKEHLMTSPFRHFGRAVRQFFVATRRMMTGEGFVKIRIDGMRYKLDVSSAWALDDGRSLDRLVTVDETMQRRSKWRQ